MPAVGEAERHQALGADGGGADRGDREGRGHQGRTHGRDAALGDHPRQRHEQDHGAEDEKQRHREGQADRRQPDGDGQQAGEQPEKRLPVGENLAAVIDLPQTADGLRHHIAQVPARHPQPDDDEGDHRPETLVGEEGIFGVEVDPLRALHAERVEDAPLQPDEDVEDPDRGRDVEVDEIEEPGPGRAEPEAEPGVAEQGHAHGALEAGKLRKVGVHAVDAQQQEGDGEAQPHGLVGEERAAHGTTALLPHHLHRYLHQRVAELLVVDPLFAHNDHRADHREGEGEKEAEPQAQRHDPGTPGDRGPLGQPLKEVAGHVLAARDHPLGDVLIVEGIPVVLGRGVVGRPEEAGDHELGEAHAGDAAGHHQHDVDGDQFRPGQHQPSVEEADRGAGQDEEEK